MFELRLDLILMCVLISSAPFWVFPFSLGAQASSTNDSAGAANAAPEVATAAAPQTDDTAWARVEDAVRSEIAQRWAVEPDEVVLEWGPHQGVGALEESAVPELVGSGSSGEWVVRLEAARGTVGVRVRAGSRQPIAVATAPMPRGRTVTPEDIQFEYRTVWGSPEATRRSTSRADLVGWVTRRRIKAGDPLARPAISPPSVVHTGESVEVAWATGSIRLTLIGRAIGTARAGEPVSVRLDTGKRVRGIAQADGSVRVSQGQRSQPEAASYLRPQPQPSVQSQPRL